MKVLLVTSWNTACGIASHSEYLKESIEAADLSIAVTPSSDALDPGHASLRFDPPAELPDWVILNYHMALHSRWTPGLIESLRQRGIRVLVVLHDTGVPNSDQAKAIHAAADVTVIHEPADDLPGAIYIRQGVPARVAPVRIWPTNQPYVGTIGFALPWKNYDLLCEAAALAGWRVCLIAPSATEDDLARWEKLQPNGLFFRYFMERTEALEWLSACDATAFLYSCANTGTSAAIRQGIAARKPVLATDANGCRQFRDLALDPVGYPAIRWLDTLTVDRVADALSTTSPVAFDPMVVRLAHQDSWQSVGRRYAEILRSL